MHRRAIHSRAATPTNVPTRNRTGAPFERLGHSDHNERLDAVEALGHLPAELDIVKDAAVILASRVPAHATAVAAERRRQRVLRARCLLAQRQQKR